MRITFGVLLALFLFSGCDPIDDKLRVVNFSNEKIYLLKSNRRKLSDKYQDDIKLNGRSITFVNYTTEIEPRDTTVLQTSGFSNHAWENFINKSCEDGKIRLYAFNIDTLQKYNWSTVLEQENYIQKIELTVEDLDALNWHVKFN